MENTLPSISYVEVTEKEVLLLLQGHNVRTALTKEQSAEDRRWVEQRMESLFWTLAGPLAIPIMTDGQVWIKSDMTNTYRAYFKVAYY